MSTRSKVDYPVLDIDGMSENTHATYQYRLKKFSSYVPANLRSKLVNKTISSEDLKKSFDAFCKDENGESACRITLAALKHFLGTEKRGTVQDILRDYNRKTGGNLNASHTSRKAVDAEVLRDIIARLCASVDPNKRKAGYTARLIYETGAKVSTLVDIKRSAFVDLDQDSLIAEYGNKALLCSRDTIRNLAELYEVESEFLFSSKKRKCR